MNKNILLKVLSFVIILAVILTAVGCSDKKPESVKDGEVGILNIDELEEKDGTIVYSNTSVNKDTGKKETFTQIIDKDTLDTPIQDNNSIINNSTNKDEFIETGKNDFGMSEEEAEEIIKKPENWKSFYIFKYIENKTDKTMVTKSLEVKNEKNGPLYIRNTLDAEYGIGAGNISCIAIYAMADMSKFESDDDLVKAFNDMGIKVQYTLTDSPYGDIDNWDEVTTDVFEIK